MTTAKTTTVRKRVPVKGATARRRAATGAALSAKTAQGGEIVLAGRGGDGLSGAQLALLSQGAQKMRRTRKVTALALEETSEIQEYAVYKMLSTASSIRFLLQAAELGGSLSEESEAFVQHLNRAWLARLAEIVGTSTERIVDLADEYSQKEPGFREFVVAVLSGEIQV